MTLLELLDRIVKEQRDLVGARRRRNELIRLAMGKGVSAYRIRQYMSERLGDDALAQTTIRWIAKHDAAQAHE
jgi:hypothetical protein